MDRVYNKLDKLTDCNTLITNICFLKYLFKKPCQQYTKYNKYDNERDKSDTEKTSK